MYQPTHQNHGLDIEHLTYDQSHSSIISASPARTSTSPRGHIPRVSMEFEEDRPVTLWPEHEPTSFAQPKMTTYLMLERRGEKEARKVKTTPADRSIEARRPSRRPLLPNVASVPTQPNPTLRRKPRLAESLKECLRSPRSAPKDENCPEKQVAIRDAIRAGRLEVAVPPSGKTNADLRKARPPQPKSPLAKPAISSNSLNKKLPPPPSKMSEFIDRSADIFDETRKEFVSKFKPPFENLNYSSLSLLGRKSRRNSDASDISFGCIGEQKNDSSPEIEALKTRQQQNSHRPSYEGGQGTDPWVHPPPQFCRLCRKPGIRGIRGLCSACENDFVRPATEKYDFVNSDNADVKLPPPLSITKNSVANNTQNSRIKRKSVSHSTLAARVYQQPQRPVEAEQKLKHADEYPLILHPSARHHSQRATIEGGDDDEEYRKWQTPAMKDEYDRAQSLVRSWSECYETDDYETWSLGRQRESNHLIDRDSNFYKFYDDLLSEHGAERSFGYSN